MKKIYLMPGEVWEYYNEHFQNSPHISVVIAEDTDAVNGCSIELSESYDVPFISVYDHNKIRIVHESVFNSLDCKDTAAKLIKDFLYPDISNPPVDRSGFEPEDDTDIPSAYDELDDELNDLIEERNTELLCAVQDLLTVFLEGAKGDNANKILTNEDVQLDIIWDIESSLFDNYGISVYHPQFMSTGNRDVDGEEETEFYEYPIE